MFPFLTACLHFSAFRIVFSEGKEGKERESYREQLEEDGDKERKKKRERDKQLAQ